MVDLDGDGMRDVISGSWPGELHFFKGSRDAQGAYTFAPSVPLLDKDGRAIHAGKASVVHAGGWDRDGDVDLVLGCIEGWVWLVPNESGSKDLAFGAPRKLEAAGAAIREHHSGPTLADWDGNGTLDLVVGQGDGSVVWYANAARAGEPQLAAAQVLHQGVEGGRSDGSRCGGRVKPHVADFNADGRLDLLMGDFAVQQPEPPQLDEAQREELQALEEQQRAVMARMTPIYTEVTRATLARLGHQVPAEPSQMGAFFEGLTDEQRKAYSEAMGAALREHEALQALQEENRALVKRIAPLKGTPSVIGHVWLRLRQAQPPGIEGPGAQD